VEGGRGDCWHLPKAQQVLTHAAALTSTATATAAATPTAAETGKTR